MDLLADCARGENKTTELLCCSTIPMSEAIRRLHEIWDHPDLQATQEDKAGVKSSTLNYFRNVFVETATAHILRTTARPRNGIWTIDPEIHLAFANDTDPNPIGKSMLSDLGMLSAGPWKLCGPTQQYIFDEVICFFCQ
jgi:hypothetical protein